jgi:hypothetical protein
MKTQARAKAVSTSKQSAGARGMTRPLHSEWDPVWADAAKKMARKAMTSSSIQSRRGSTLERRAPLSSLAVLPRITMARRTFQ